MLEFVFTQACPWALVVILLGAGLYAFAKGLLVPGSSLRELERLVATYWKAWDREHARCELLEKQLDESMELSRTSAHVLTAVAAAAGVEATQGDGENAPTSAVA